MTERTCAGGVKHSDSDLVETGMLSAKKTTSLNRR